MSAIVPAPLPDECVRSVAQRLALLRGDMRGRFGMTRGVLPLLADQGGLSAEALIKDHSHVGYLRFVSKAFASIPVHEHRDLRMHFAWLRWPTARPRVCLTCLGEDLDRLGVGYYRRAHQLPGIEACLTHATPLVFKHGIEVDPLVRALKGTKAVNKSYADHLGHPVVERFVSLSMMALRSTIPLEPATMAAALRRRLAMNGENIEGKRLGDWARSVLPSKWTATHFAALLARPLGSPASLVDFVFYAGHAVQKTSAYLLAMALLWDSPKEAMHDCSATLAPSKSVDPNGAGLRALKAVLQGRSIMSACRAEGANMQALEVAMRTAFDTGLLSAEAA